MIPTLPHQRTVRGPYFKDITYRAEAEQSNSGNNGTDYAAHYNMVHLRGMFRLNRPSNNGRTDGGLN